MLYKSVAKNSEYSIAALAALLLVGCSQTPAQPVQKAQKARITPQTTLNFITIFLNRLVSQLLSCRPCKTSQTFCESH
jgi:PBP1b-binding outer membrane lipoprotein LpoB